MQPALPKKGRLIAGLTKILIMYSNGWESWSGKCPAIGNLQGMKKGKLVESMVWVIGAISNNEDHDCELETNFAAGDEL